MYMCIFIYKNKLECIYILNEDYNKVCIKIYLQIYIDYIM